MSIIGGLTTITRGFGALFGGAKSLITDIQTSMASLIPPMPGLPVGKFYDLAIGIDFHPIIFPWPLPICPVPHIGMVFDLTAAIMSGISSILPDPGDNPVLSVGCALAKGMAPSVKVHGQWVAQAGIEIIHLPGIILHVLPTVTAKAESEMWMGSSIVLADGGPCSTQYHPALSCNLVGFPSILRKGKPPKPKVALMAPTSLMTIITSSGKPVLVGGPPTIDLFQLAFKLGMKGIAKAKQLKKAQKNADELIPPKKSLEKVQKPENRCSLGEPVDAATGRVYHTNTDFELSGPIPLVWSRTYYSDAKTSGPLGYNWHHSYNVSILRLDEKNFVLRHADGRESRLPVLMDGETHYDRTEKLYWSRDNKGYLLRDNSRLYYRFNTLENRYGYSPISEISTADGFSIKFGYSYNGDLKDITDSCGKRLFVENDMEGRVISVSTQFENETIFLVRYYYDAAGNLAQTKDCLDVKKTFEYEGHLLVKLTNQSGMSFYWQYEGYGDKARCIHTWGDGGIQEYFFEYAPGMTRTCNGENAITEYYYTEDKLIYKIVDACGGITHRQYNEWEELELVVDAEGFSRKTQYDDWGNPVKITNENGEFTLFGYDERQNLTRVKTPGGRELKWEYDECDRVIRRKLPSGDQLTYTYEDKKLKYITDKEKRRFDFEFSDRMELETLIYPNGLFRRWQYDKRGRMIKSTDVKGNATLYQYDRADNVIQINEPDGNTHYFQYDASGNLIHAKDNLREVEFTYGPLGTLTSRSQGKRTVRFGYNTELQLTSIRNEKLELYKFELDGMGQVVGEWGFDRLERRYDRDGLGRVQRVIRPGNRWTDYVYDGTGNVIKEEQYDEAIALYSYDPDGLLLNAHNDNCKVGFCRDKSGRIISEKQNEYLISHVYDEEGNHTGTSSSLGANIECSHDPYGYLKGMTVGKEREWQATWERDETGLEIKRSIGSGLEITTWRDNFGREIKKHISQKGGIASGSYSYRWGINNRLLQKTNDLTDLITSFEYNEFDDLIKADYREGGTVETIYRTPDRIGALYKTWTCRDREYDKGGKLIEDPECYYHYDGEGNLIFKEYKITHEEGFILTNKKKRAKELCIEYRGSGTGWQYDWYSTGMLKRVIRPDGKAVEFRYDALGRRTVKIYNGKITRWVWNGNTPLHECTSKLKSVEEIKISIQKDDENLITWIFEDGTFVPVAKITKDDEYTIVTDYLGTPIQMYNKKVEKTWDCTLDIYGKVRIFEGSSLSDCPWRFQGQYEDEETGLYYNRFRFYDPNAGSYLSQDPIGLAGNNPTLYAYVYDTNLWVDVLGLAYANGGNAPKHGGIGHNNSIDSEILRLQADPTVANIRKNQQQVDVNGKNVGNNRPDIQYDQNGVHHNVEYDTTAKGSTKHQNQIPTNDPTARNTYWQIDDQGNIVTGHSQLPQSQNRNGSNGTGTQQNAKIKGGGH